MKGIFVLSGIIVLIVIGSVFLFSTGNAVSPLNGNVIGNQEVQIVKLFVSGGNYIMEPSEIKKGIPVRLEADMTKMPGCSKAIVIPSFSISKTLTPTDNVIEFVPNKAGTFNIACSMNMYRGSFTVLEEDGTKSDYVEQVNIGRSCGGGCGGCGG